MKNLMTLLVVGLIGTGCAGRVSPEQLRLENEVERLKTAVARSKAEQAHLEAVTSYTKELQKHQQFRVDLALQKHATGEISDKDLMEIAGQLHKQSLSRINAEKGLVLMDRETLLAQSDVENARRVTVLKILNAKMCVNCGGPGGYIAGVHCEKCAEAEWKEVEAKQKVRNESLKAKAE